MLENRYLRYVYYKITLITEITLKRYIEKIKIMGDKEDV